MRTDRSYFLEVGFDKLTLDEVVEELESSSQQYRYVVTPNVDHMVRLHSQGRFSTIYEDADLCVCDSQVLRALAWLAGIRLTLVRGSDLTARLFENTIKPGDRIGVIGGSREMLELLGKNCPGVEIVHHDAPMGLATNSGARTAAARFIAKTGARFAFIVVGSPQAEMIANEARNLPGSTGTALCVGASLEFITGERKRAPRWARRIGLEWAHRLADDPRRLWRRYLVDGVAIFPLFVRWLIRTRPFRTFGATGAVIVFSAGLLAAAAGNYTARGVSPSVDRHPGTPAARVILPPPDRFLPLSREAALSANSQRAFVDRTDFPAARFILPVDGEARSRAVLCLSQAVYYEAAGEPLEGMKAVAQVVLNRVRHPAYPASVCGVVYEGSFRKTGCQFSFTCDGSLNRVPTGWAWDQARRIAQSALSGEVFAPVGHATHYHADYVLPLWANSLDKSLRIGAHLFYRFRGALGNRPIFAQKYSAAELIPPTVLAAGREVIHERPATSLVEALDQPSIGPSQNVKDNVLLADVSAGTLMVPTRPAEATPKKVAQKPCARQERQLQPLRANQLQSTSTRTC